MVGGCVSAHGMGNLRICEGTINAERYLQVLEQHMLPSKQRLFHGRPCLFQQDNANPHSACVTTTWLRSKRVGELGLPAYSPDLSPIENVWRIMKRKYDYGDPGLLNNLSCTSSKNGKEFHLQSFNNCFNKCPQQVSSVPKRLLSVVTRQGEVTQW